MPARSYNTTLGWMAAIAGLAFVLGLALSRELMTATFSLAAAVLLLVIPAVFLQGWLDVFLGVACPHCKHALQLVGMRPFDDRFYRCPECTRRFRRSPVPILGVLLDASDPVYDPYFERKLVENPWTLPPDLDEDEVGEMSKTHGSLLRSKRRRNPDSPNVPKG